MRSPNLKTLRVAARPRPLRLPEHCRSTAPRRETAEKMRRMPALWSASTRRAPPSIIVISYLSLVISHILNRVPEQGLVFAHAALSECIRQLCHCGIVRCEPTRPLLFLVRLRRLSIPFHCNGRVRSPGAYSFWPCRLRSSFHGRASESGYGWRTPSASATANALMIIFTDWNLNFLA